MRILAQTHYSFTDIIKTFRNGNPTVYVGITLPYKMYEGWNFNFGNTLLAWIQELLE